MNSDDPEDSGALDRRPQATELFRAVVLADRRCLYRPPWHDAALFAAVLALIMMCLLAGCGAVTEAIQYDSLAREKIDADIAARAKRALAGLAAIQAGPELDAVAEDLEAIIELGTTGVHRAQTAQLFWNAKKPDTPLLIATEANPSPEDDRQVVAFAGIALERSRSRWWPRTPKELADSVSNWAGRIARAVIIEVPKAIIPWYLWPVIIVIALGSLISFGWYCYQKYVVRPRLQRQIEEAKLEVARKDRAIDQYDAGIEELPPELRGHVGKGLELQLEHARRNQARKDEERRLLDAVLPVPKKTDRIMGLIHQECEKRERDTNGGTAP